MESKFGGFMCRCYLLVILTLAGGIGVSVSYRMVPEDAMVWTGQDAVFRCYDDTVNATNPLYWTRQQSNNSTTLFSTAGIQPDPAKYSVEQDAYVLRVKNAQLSDAVAFCCSTAVSNESCANLVIIDSLLPSVSPSVNVSVGDRVNLTCTLNYAAPRGSFSSNPVPNLSVHLGEYGNTTQSGPPNVESDTIDTTRLIYTMYNVKILPAHVGYSKIVCKVKSEKPKGEYKRESPMTVTMPVDRVSISMKKVSTDFNVGDFLNCTATGFPNPTVTWMDDVTRGPPAADLRPGTGFAEVRLKYPGQFHWTCLAWNAMNTAAVNASFSFTVNSMSYTARPCTVTIGIGILVFLSHSVFHAVEGDFAFFAGFRTEW